MNSSTVSTKQLDDVRIEMALLGDDPRDTEACHVRADELLIETIEYLIAGENPVIEAQAKAIIGEFQRMDKWYA